MIEFIAFYINLIVMGLGLYLILDGIFSILFQRKESMSFQVWRFFRILIGVFFIILPLYFYITLRPEPVSIF